jgi:outer membrane lipoprotein-sorting protein
MTCFLRRLPLSRLLLLCGLVVLLGSCLTALAFALSTGPTPPPKPLADAVHDALTAAPVQGVSAQIQLTDHLLEGANLASGTPGAAGGLSSSPLLNGASGRLWIAGDGRVRLELQSENGDTEIYCDGRTVSMYDASSNTLYRLTLPAHAGGSGENFSLGSSGSGSSAGSGSSDSGSSTAPHEIPSVAKIEEAISHLSAHANVSGATPTDIAGQPAYTVRVSPKEGGSLLGGAELSWDAVHGVPLRAAVYSSTNASAPVLELAATSISYGPVEPSVFAFTPPANAKIEELVLPDHHAAPDDSTQGGEHPKFTSQGHGLSTVGVLESKVGHTAGTAGSGADSSPAPLEGLPQVKIDGTPAAELTTELGTLLTFERSGVRYLLAGAVAPSAVEAVAKGLQQ